LTVAASQARCAVVGGATPGRWLVLGLVWLVAPAASAEGHPLSVSYSHWNVEGRAVDLRLRLPLDDVDLLLQLDQDLDGTVSDPEIERAREAIGEYVAKHVRLTADGRTLASELVGVSTWKDDQEFSHVEVRLTYPAPDVIDTAAMTSTLLTDLYPAHRTLADIRTGDRRAEFVFQHGNTYTVTRGMGSRWATAKAFLILGFEHILTGYDHVLFLFGLLLVGRGLRQLVAIVTSFTIAHSVTLSLATLGLIEPTAWTIEAAIALSIVYVGVENLVSANVSQRWKIAFGFGLIHGFGFSNILREMELPRSSLAVSLLTFNTGVEIGQITIILVMFPLLRLMGRTHYHVLVTRYGSALMVVIGLYWFFERVR
jgi:hypothetical protein